MPVPPWEEVDDGAVVDGGTVDDSPGEQPNSGSSSGQKSTGAKPTSKARGKRQRRKKQQAVRREDAQLNGSIPTTPEGAVRNEVVDPSTQSEQVFPGLVATAIRKGWAVPEMDKPGLVDELIQIAQDPEQGAKVRIQAFNALRLADAQQYSQDHPEQQTSPQGSISIQANITAVQIIRDMVEAGQLISDVQTDTSGLLNTNTEETARTHVHVRTPVHVRIPAHTDTPVHEDDSVP